MPSQFSVNSENVNSTSYRNIHALPTIVGVTRKMFIGVKKCPPTPSSAEFKERV